METFFDYKEKMYLTWINWINILLIVNITVF